MLLAFSLAVWSQAQARPIARAVPEPRATAWASGRPPECSEAIGQATNVWERAKSPALRRYCDLVASASSKLVGPGAMPEAALNDAREAAAVAPGHAAPRALEGRALAAMGRTADAMTALRDAIGHDGGVLDDPATLLVWARVLARSGDAAGSADAYRALLPRLDGLGRSERTAATTEAGLAQLALGSTRLDDAVAALRESVRDADEETQAIARVALALALDRRGANEEARMLLFGAAGAQAAEALAAKLPDRLAAAAGAESLALEAYADEAAGRTGPARDAWQKYVAAAPSGPWADHARSRLAGLSRGPGRAR